jgi:hypothetical protein
MMSEGKAHGRPTEERLMEEMEEFARRHDLESEWRAFCRERDLRIHEPAPEGAGIDYAPDMRDRRKGARRTGGSGWSGADRRSGRERRRV